MHSERSGKGGGGHGAREAKLPPSWPRGTGEHGGGGGGTGKCTPGAPRSAPLPAASLRPDPAGTAGAGTAVTRRRPPRVAAGRGREAVNGQGAAEAGGVRRRASRRGPPGELPAGCPPPPSRAALCPGAHGPAGHGGARRRARRQRGTGFVPRPPQHGSARLGIARRGAARTTRHRTARLGSTRHGSAPAAPEPFKQVAPAALRGRSWGAGAAWLPAPEAPGPSHCLFSLTLALYLTMK